MEVIHSSPHHDILTSYTACNLKIIEHNPLKESCMIFYMGNERSFETQLALMTPSGIVSLNMI